MRQEPQIDFHDGSPPEHGRFSFALTLAAAAVVVIAAALYLLPGRQSPPGAAPQGRHFAFGPDERAYALKIHIEGIALSRAENFLNQEITTLTGELVNGGDRMIRGVEVTIEFSDELHQIALRDTRSVLAPELPALTTGGRRTFEVSFEHIPASWNMQQPSVNVSGLQF